MNLKFKGSGTSNGVNGTYPHNCYPYKVKRNKDLWDAVLPFPRFPELASIFLIASAATLCYYNSIDGDFVFDDSEAVVNNDDLKPETPIWNLLQNDFWGTRLVHNASHKSYRPLTVLSFRWNYLLSGGLKPWGFHMTNILLHALVSVLSVPVFNFLFGGNSPQAAVLSALLFAVHPIHSEAVAGIVGRADLLCALFFFLSFLVYCHAVQQQELRGILLVILSMLLCTVSMFCKEQGITVIGLCSAYDIIVGSKLHPVRVFETIKKVIMDAFFRRLFLVQSDSDEDDNEDEGDMKTELPPVVIRHLFLAATGISLLLLRWRIMGSSPPIFQKVDNPASFADSLITRVLSYNYIYAINAWLLVCPVWLCFDWSMGCVPLLKSLDDHRGVYVLVFWLMLLVLLYKSFTGKNVRSRRCLTMALALLIVPFLPATNLFFRVGFVIAERVLYLPSAGFCMLVVLGMRELATLPRGKVLLQVGYFYLVLIFSLRAILRSSEWRTEKALFKTGLNVCPLNAKVHYNIAKNGGDSGNRTLAVVEYREALRLNPDYDQAMNNLANILKDEGKLKEAEALLRRAVTLRSDFAAAWMNLGIVLSGQKQHQEAEKSYFTALQHRKKYPDCLYNLGNLYLDQKQYQDAYRAWRNATTLKPTHTVAWSNMIIMLDSIGEVAQAESVAHEALALLPHEPSLHFNLANSLGKRGRFAEAEKHFLEALRLDRKNAMYHANLGVLYHRWKKFEKAEKLYKRSLEINPHLQSAKDNLRLLYKTLGKG